MEVKKLGVIGAGQMGNGIAQVAAMSGLNVIMNDVKAEFVERGLATISKDPTPEGPALETPGGGYNALPPEGARMSCPDKLK
jgi:3-hydroxyacyl-CoA dehydrogenase